MNIDICGYGYTCMFTYMTRVSTQVRRRCARSPWKGAAWHTRPRRGGAAASPSTPPRCLCPHHPPYTSIFLSIYPSVYIYMYIYIYKYIYVYMDLCMYMYMYCA